MTKKNVKTMMLILVVLIIGLYFVAGTYARYTSTVDGNANAKVAKWAVSLNGDDMTTMTEKIELNFSEVENDDVVDGYIAPGAELYSDVLEINPEGTQVVMNYTIELGEITSAVAELNDKIAIARVEQLVDGEWTELEDFTVGNAIEDTIELPDQNTALRKEDSVSYRIVLAWENNEANNSTDTELGTVAPDDVSMTVKVTAQQHISEPDGN